MNQQQSKNVNELKAFTSIDECVKLGLIRSGRDENDSLYTKFLYFAMQVVNELEADAFNNQKNLLLAVQPTLTNTGLKWIKLPDNFVNYSFIGFLNTLGERVPLSLNQNMVGEFEEEQCHCSCGCGNTICEELSQPITTNTDVSLKAPVKTCNYAANFSFLSSLSFTINTVVQLNEAGEATTLQIQKIINSQSDLDYLMISLGWTVISPYNYSISSPTVWVQFNAIAFSVPETIYIDENSCAYNPQTLNLINSETIQTNSKGDICKESKIWGVNTITQQANYYLSVTGLTYPLTSVNYKKNGQIFTLSNIPDLQTLYATLTGIGLRILNTSTAKFGINQTTDVWENFTFTNNATTIIVDDFTSAASTTKTLGQNIIDEQICHVEKKECGCLVITQTEINVLTQYGSAMSGIIERYMKGSGLFQTFGFPYNSFGWYNVDLHRGKIYLNPEFNQQAILVTYYSLQNIDSEKYLIPYLFKDTVSRYCKWSYLDSKQGIPDYMVQRAKKEYYTEKKKARQRFDPIILEEVIDLQRLKIRP